jgi:hypothetical protein
MLITLSTLSNMSQIDLFRCATGSASVFHCRRESIFIEKTLAEYKDRKGDLMDQFARVYALNFSMEEMTQIVAFYDSPVGQKLTNANASLNEGMQTIMGIFEANLKREFFAKVRAELKAAGFDT